MRLRFTIRDLLWLTAVIAIGTAWFADRAIIRRERDNLERQQAELNAHTRLLADQRAVMSEQLEVLAKEKEAYSEMNQQLESRLRKLGKTASSPSEP
jgi:hypothetical protein